MLMNLMSALNKCDFEIRSYGKANHQINIRSMQLNGVVQELLILLQHPIPPHLLLFISRPATVRHLPALLIPSKSYMDLPPAMFLPVVQAQA